MKNGLILTIASWAAVLSMMAVICWHLAGAFAPAYPEPTERFTESSYQSLEYQRAQCKERRVRAERFIEELASGKIK